MPHWQDLAVIAFNTLVFWLGRKNFEPPPKRDENSPK
jgi:hypothetical protein